MWTKPFSNFNNLELNITFILPNIFYSREKHLFDLNLQSVMPAWINLCVCYLIIRS